jgi:hypothetical protein
MMERVHELLQEFEDLQAAGTIETFTVKVFTGGLLVEPIPEAERETRSVSLSAELIQTLEIFFSDIKGITFNSHDYTTLKGLLNAHGTLQRMARLSKNKGK